MNKSELIEALASGMGGTKVEAGRFLDTLITTFTDAVKRGDQIVIPGFMSLSVVPRAARSGVNPKTGQKIEIKAKSVPKIKAGKALKEAVEA